MSCCVAALCENGRTIVYASDRKISDGIIESEPRVPKILTLHPAWRLMYAGRDISPVFDIADQARKLLPKNKRFDIQEVDRIIGQCYSKVVSSPNQYHLSLLLFGFNESGKGYISHIAPATSAKAVRRNSPGFWAIGSGQMGALYMMDYRQVSYKEPLARMLFAVY